MNNIPSPAECGLPAKFEAWRAKQEEAIDVMITSKRRFVALSAPTGFGKSPAYIAYALLSGKSTLVITNSKGLQDQLLRDYSSIGLVDIRGRANYPCEMRDDYSCQEGYAMRCPYKGSIQCPASQAEMRACQSKLVVTNYDKWVATARFAEVQWPHHFEQIVFDEGHDAPDALASAMQIYLSFDDIEKLLQIEYPLSNEHFVNWKIWACRAQEIAVQRLKEQQDKLEAVSHPKPSWVKTLLHIKNTVRKLATICTARPQNWVVEEVEGGFQFDCIKPGQYAEGILFLHRPHIIIVSATLRPKTMYMLGVPASEYTFKEFDSDFDRARCPIYWIPTMRVDARVPDLSMLWVRLDQIISRRMDRKGIVHTISYARQADVVERSRYKDHLLANVKGGLSTGEVIDRFRKSGPGTVMVSPSISTGYDFPGKDCEWQFLCKIPFPDGRSKIMQARQTDDKEYGPYQAMQSMVQSFGRGMRSREDQCENFIADDHLAWFLPKYSHLAPRSFHNHFRRVDVVPQPPPPLE